MDIITHALIGLVASGPFIVEQPALAAGILAGSVMPDMDVVARFFGKRAMLRAHQTASHALPVLAAVAMMLAVLPVPGVSFAIGFFGGAALHVLLDYSNTLGVTLWWPLIPQRLQRGWVFFLDAFVTGSTLLALAVTVMQFLKTGTISPWIAATLACVLAAYWRCKAWLLTQARELAGPQAVSLIPSALIPWHFWVCSRSGSEITVALLNVRSATPSRVTRYEVMDEQVQAALADLPEWQLMRGLSPAYHVIKIEVENQGSRLLCRDLRIRNFNSRYGDLEVNLDADGKRTHVQFHV